NVRPVDVQVVVRQQRVGALAVLSLDSFELFQRTLARLVEEPLFDVCRQLDRIDAEVALIVDLDRRVTRCAGCLLVCSEERVLECGDQRPALDALFALDVPDCLDDFLCHLVPTSSIRLPRTIESYGMSTDSASVLTVTLRSSAATTSPRSLLRPEVRTATRRPTTLRK